MRTRILEGEDVWRLGDVPGPFQGQREVLAQLGNTKVVAVEDDQGQILAYWPIWVAVHLEPLWVHPDSRKNRTVIKLLLTEMQAQLQAERITTAFAMISHAEMPTNLPLADRIGFKRVAGDLFFAQIRPAAEEVEDADGSSSDSGDLDGRPVLYEPGHQQADRAAADDRNAGPPKLGD